MAASDYIDDDMFEEVGSVLAAKDVANQPVMSLHAIAGICMEDTMHLYVHGHCLLVLLDYGSTHNFINASTPVAEGRRAGGLVRHKVGAHRAGGLPSSTAGGCQAP